MVELTRLLIVERGEILESARAALRRAHLPHYEAAGAEDAGSRLSSLFDLLVDGIARRDLTTIIEYSERVAEERYAAGYSLGEVQTAFNTLEEAAWTVVLNGLDPTEAAKALGLIGTVLGAGKDALARRYVSLAANAHASSLDLQALSSGAAS
jgi:hypothetical protein